MRLLSKAKDGGPQSPVNGYWLIQWKRLFSVLLLCFENGSRDEYHDHAFWSINWLLSGRLVEHILDPSDPSRKEVRDYWPSIIPIITRRSRMHRVVSEGRTWVFSIRGPWARRWREYIPRLARFVWLTNGRRVVDG